MQQGIIDDMVCLNCRKRLGNIKYFVPVGRKDKDDGIGGIRQYGEKIFDFLCDECAAKEVTQDETDATR